MKKKPKDMMRTQDGIMISRQSLKNTLPLNHYMTTPKNPKCHFCGIELDEKAISKIKKTLCKYCTGEFQED